MTRKIVVLGTGGTLAGRAADTADHVGYVAGQVAIDDLVAGLRVPSDIELVAEQVAQVDSKDMGFALWRRLALRCAHWLARDDVAGIVVGHGTDTLEETAYFLQRVLAPAKPVVLTGAMRPASSAVPDGPQNLADALAVAAVPGARGVVVAFAGVLHGPADVAKVHPYRLDAFSSGDAGPLGHVEAGALRLLRPWPPAGDGFGAEALPEAADWPAVDIVMSHAGVRADVVSALVRAGARGLVAACTGNGTLHAGLEAALQEVRRQGVRVLRATRCAQGAIVGDPDAQGLPHAGGLSPVKARIALMLELMPRP